VACCKVRAVRPHAYDLSALSQEIRARMETQREAFIDQDDAFAAARRTIGAACGA